MHTSAVTLQAIQMAASPTSGRRKEPNEMKAINEGGLSASQTDINIHSAMGINTEKRRIETAGESAKKSSSAAAPEMASFQSPGGQAAAAAKLYNATAA